MIPRPDEYSRECKRVIALANRGEKVARCVFCGQLVSKYADPLEIGFSIVEKPRKKYVLWHIDCYCRNNEISRADYCRIEREDF